MEIIISATFHHFFTIIVENRVASVCVRNRISKNLNLGGLSHGFQPKQCFRSPGLLRDCRLCGNKGASNTTAEQKRKKGSESHHFDKRSTYYAYEVSQRSRNGQRGPKCLNQIKALVLIRLIRLLRADVQRHQVLMRVLRQCSDNSTHLTHSFEKPRTAVSVVEYSSTNFQ